MIESTAAKMLLLLLLLLLLLCIPKFCGNLEFCKIIAGHHIGLGIKI